MRVAFYRTFPGTFTLNHDLHGAQDDTGQTFTFNMREGFHRSTRSMLQFNIQSNSDVELFIHLNGTTIFGGNVAGQHNGFRSCHFMLPANALNQTNNRLEFGINPQGNNRHISIGDVFILHAAEVPD